MERLNLNLTGEFMDTAADAINSLQVLSKELDRLSMKGKIFPTDLGQYLEQISQDCHKYANELTWLSSLYGDI